MGVFESCIGPCWATITAMFYKGQEQGTRCTAWYFMVGVAAIVGGLLSYGNGHVNSVAVDQWQLVVSARDIGSYLKALQTDFSGF
jgi:hypothetical protein